MRRNGCRAEEPRADLHRADSYIASQIGKRFYKDVSAKQQTSRADYIHYAFKCFHGSLAALDGARPFREAQEVLFCDIPHPDIQD